ncbi:MAG: type IV secretion system DNA-binding domain-containing protein [Candidatus Kerfeldbacteria bacterium]
MMNDEPTAQPEQPEQEPQPYAFDEQQVTFFAGTNFRNENRRFGIKGDDRRRHMYVIGKTGMGKSTMLENMIIQDIRNGHGLAVVDPHGDLVEKIVDFIPSNRINDVVYFNPADVANPIAFNILENVELEYKNLVSNGLVGVFKKIWADSWGPRLEYILINSILALIEYPGSTLLGVTRMLVDAKYRKKVVRNITDPVVKSFWIDEYNNYSEKFRNEAIAPIQNKVGQFLSSSLIRNIVGQPKSTINMREIMDSGKILLMNLSKGRIGEENAALLGAMMITKIQLAAMSRVDIPEKERRDFFLYVDEFQNFSTEAFANILSEARKYRLDLIMAHQYVEQLSDEVKAAVFGNVGTMITFRVGAVDAEELEKEYLPLFTQEDLVALPSYQIYLRLMIDGVASEPFSATTLPPLSGETGNKETVIQVSRERYANVQAKVEEAILRWSGYNMDDDGSDDEEQPQQAKKSYRKEERKYEKKGGKPPQRQKPRADAPPTPTPAPAKPTISREDVPMPPKKQEVPQPPKAAEQNGLAPLRKKELSFVADKEQNEPQQTQPVRQKRRPEAQKTERSRPAQRDTKKEKQDVRPQQGQRQRIKTDFSSLGDALGALPVSDKPTAKRKRRRRKKKPANSPQTGSDN